MSKLEALFLSETVLRLILAAVLGGLVGVERQFHRKPAGLRTIMFITFGSALFTVVSQALSTIHGGDPQRIAAQLIPGIGFIGAGSIIHARGSVVGLTTAATIFVMASIGMACGGGLYWIALFSTFLLLGSLLLLGWLERVMKWKTQAMTYTVTTHHLDQTMGELNQVLDEEHLAMQHVRCHRLDGLYTVEFSLEVPEELHHKLVRRFGELESARDMGHSERTERQ